MLIVLFDMIKISLNLNTDHSKEKDRLINEYVLGDVDINWESDEPQQVLFKVVGRIQKIPGVVVDIVLEDEKVLEEVKERGNS